MSSSAQVNIMSTRYLTRTAKRRNLGIFKECNARNNRALIFRLPTETISDIFKYVQKHYDDKDEESKRWKWFKITHVCRAWRNIAINTQTLWTYIETCLHSSTDQTSAYLLRSGTSHLVVRHHRGDDQALKCLLLTLTHIGRVRELEIWDLEDAGNSILLGLLALPALVMEKFLFHGTSEFDGSRLFSGLAPKLKILSLLTPTKSWSSIPIIRNLKYLHFGSHRTPPSLQEILSILAANPDLERLGLYTSLGRPQLDITLPLKEPIQLQFLRDIYATEIDARLLSKLFSNIVFPKNVSYDLSCHTNPGDDVDRKGFIPAAVNREDACSTLFITIDAEFIQIETDPAKRRHNGIKENSVLEFEWTDESGSTYIVEPGNALEFICSIVKGRYWATATELYVNFNGEDYDLSGSLATEPWVELLKLLPRLQKISIESVAIDEGKVLKDSHKGVLEALETTSLASDGETVQYLCSDLTHLCLVGYDFKVDTMRLIDTLRFRAENGLRLHRFEAHDPFGDTDPFFILVEAINAVDEFVVVQSEDQEE